MMKFKRIVRFKLRTLLIVVTVVCLALGLLLQDALRYQRRKVAAKTLIDSFGGTVEVAGYSLLPSPGNNWLSRLFLETERRQMLWRVDLSGTKVAALDLAQLSKCDWIRCLNLNETNVTDNDLRHIVALDKMRELQLAGTKISDEGLSHLQPLERLVLLNAGDTEVTYVRLEALDEAFGSTNFGEQTALANLAAANVVEPFPYFLLPSSGDRYDDETHLYFNITQSAYPIDIQFFRKSIPPSVFLHLRHLKGVTHLSLSFAEERFEDVDLVSNLKELRYLSIDGGQLTDSDFQHIASLPKLGYLRLGGSHNISDAAFEQLGENSTIKYLNLRGTNITMEITSHLCGLRNLHTLQLHISEKNSEGKYGELSGNRTEAARKPISRLRCLPKLESLHLSGNVWSDEALSSLPELPHLKQLVYDEGRLSAETMSQLQEKMPYCEFTTPPTTIEINLD